MSNLETQCQLYRCDGGRVLEPAFRELNVKPRTVGGGLPIGRALPQSELRMVGPWCFLDHIGPLNFEPGQRVDVPTHPHIGLQTVTWLLSGQMFHRDSLGYQQLVTPGQLNLMTAGEGISHSEESPEGELSDIHGVQFWVALPESAQSIAPDFEHHADLPTVVKDGIETTVIMGEMAGKQSPATIHSPLLAAQIRSERDGRAELPLNPGFHHAVMLLGGDARLEGTVLNEGSLYDLGADRETLDIEMAADTALILIGGEPFERDALLWWNFVAFDRERIERARADWQDGHERFGTVPSYPGSPLPAPELSGRLVGE